MAGWLMRGQISSSRRKASSSGRRRVAKRVDSRVSDTAVPQVAIEVVGQRGLRRESEDPEEKRNAEDENPGPEGWSPGRTLHERRRLLPRWQIGGRRPTPTPEPRGRGHPGQEQETRIGGDRIVESRQKDERYDHPEGRESENAGGAQSTQCLCDTRVPARRWQRCRI